ncbi:MAG: hypothetical protein ACLUKO_13980 [Enterocloster bolteae]
MNNIHDESGIESNKNQCFVENNIETWKKIEWIANMYGYDAQSRQCMEEAAELIQAINKRWRKAAYGGNDKEIAAAEERIIDEMVDVIIMLWQLKLLLGVREHVLEEKIEDKLNRQLERMIRKTSILEIKEEIAIWNQKMCPVATKGYWPKCMAYDTKTGKCTGIIVCQDSPYDQKGKQTS